MLKLLERLKAAESLEQEFLKGLQHPSRAFKMLGKTDKSESVDKTMLPEMFEDSGVTFKDGDDERTFFNRASNGAVDSDGDILNPDGWVLEDFKTNPVLLFNHDMDQSVGAVIKVWSRPRADAIKGVGEPGSEHLANELVSFSFFDHSKQGDDLVVKYATGILRSFSVRFDPHRIKTVTETERTELGLGRWGFFFEKQALIELSAVTVPANKDAIVLAKNRHVGLSTDDLHNYHKSLDSTLQQLCQVVEGLKTVGERQRRFDEMEAQIKSFLNDPKPTTRSDELYGGRIDDASLANMIKSAQVHISSSTGA
jgi:hypothetical protein